MKNILPFLFTLITSTFIFGQSAEKSPFSNTSITHFNYTNNPPNTVNALWDLEFDYTIVNDTLSSLASVVHFNNEFWVGEWNTSNLARLNNDGEVLEIFTIPSIFGVRAMTWDGTNIWLSNNTQTIFEINPSNKSIVSTLNLPFVDNVRFLTYDETADGGNGGFWVGNFSSDIALFSKTGLLLSTIPIGTHTLTEIYGAVVDNVSEGGPYLWAFQQAGDGLNGLIVQLKLPEGTTTGVARDVEIDLETEDGLAGGLFLTNSWGSGLTLGGILQISDDFERLFGYELSFETSENVDIKIVDVTEPSSGCELTVAEDLTVLLENTGAVASFDIPLEIYQNNVLVATEIVTDTIAIGETLTYTFNEKLDLSEIDFYELTVIAAAAGDVNNSNNQAEKTVSNRPIVGSPIDNSFENLPLGSTIFPNLYNIGDIPFQVNTGATVSLGTGPASSPAGDDGHYIYMESSNGIAGSQAVLTTTCINLSEFYEPTASFGFHAYGDGIDFLKVEVLDEMGELHELFLAENQQQTSSEALWLFATIDLAAFEEQQIEIIFTGAIDSMGQSFNADIALDNILIEENFVDVEEIEALKDFSIFPNPTSKHLFINIELTTQQTVHLQLLNNLGQPVFNLEKEHFLNEHFVINVADLPKGIYFLKMMIDDKMTVQRVIIQ
jgi:hypothetical protein